jgi:membrane protease subunit HflC
MSRSAIAGIIALLVALWVGSMSMFTVSETQLAILLRLGKIVRADYKPGLHFMVPFVNSVRKFDKRILTLDANPEQVLTGEKKNVMVDYYVKWRIQNVEAYYLAYGGLEKRARDRLSDIIKDGLQSEFDKRTIRQVVSDDRAEIMHSLAARANTEMGKFGIRIVDVRIKQIELPPGVRRSVFERMRTERDRIAKEHRAKGRRAAKIIEAQANRKRTEMLAEAHRKAEEIKGAGDALATEVYAKAYGQDPEFYEFYRSLMAYRDAFDNKHDVLVLQPDSEFFKYFNSTTPAAAGKGK